MIKDGLENTYSKAFFDKLLYMMSDNDEKVLDMLCNNISTEKRGIYYYLSDSVEKINVGIAS